MTGSASPREVLPAGLCRGIAAIAIASATLSLAAQQPAPFTASASLVVVPVVVVDNKGATIPDLPQSDFEVFEDGKPVAIQTFLPPAAEGVTGEEGRFIVIALDNLLTRAEIGFRVKTIAMQFVDRLGPRDVMSVISLNRGNAVTTTSRAELKAAIGRFTPAFGEETWTGDQKAEHGLRMITSLSQQVAKAPHRRKVMVFIGSAAIFSPSLPSAFGDRGSDVSPYWTDAIRETSRNNVSVYTIDPAGLAGSPGDWSRSFAAETGGYAWTRTNNWGAAADRIFEESASYYLIGYSAPINDQRLHKIEVKVAKRGATVRARRLRG